MRYTCDILEPNGSGPLTARPYLQDSLRYGQVTSKVSQGPLCIVPMSQDPLFIVTMYQNSPFQDHTVEGPSKQCSLL